MTCRTAARIAFALSLISFGMANAIAADTRIYKCVEPNGGTLYTDQPCSGGRALDIRLGPVDPNALTRLARARAEFDAAEAKRRAEQARLDELNRRQQQQMESQQHQEPGAPLEGDDYLDDGPWYGSFDGDGRHDRRRHDRRFERDDDGRIRHESGRISAGALEHGVPVRK